MKLSANRGLSNAHSELDNIEKKLEKYQSVAIDLCYASDELYNLQPVVFLKPGDSARIPVYKADGDGSHLYSYESSKKDTSGKWGSYDEENKVFFYTITAGKNK